MSQISITRARVMGITALGEISLRLHPHLISRRQYTSIPPIRTVNILYMYINILTEEDILSIRS